jgi:hypothetical protein
MCKDWAVIARETDSGRSISQWQRGRPTRAGGRSAGRTARLEAARPTRRSSHSPRTGTWFYRLFRTRVINGWRESRRMRFRHAGNWPRCHYGPCTAGAKIATRLVNIDARNVRPVVPCPSAHRYIGQSIVRRSRQSLRAGHGLGTSASTIVQNSPKQASRSLGSTSRPIRHWWTATDRAVMS